MANPSEVAVAIDQLGDGIAEFKTSQAAKYERLERFVNDTMRELQVKAGRGAAPGGDLTAHGADGPLWLTKAMAGGSDATGGYVVPDQYLRELTDRVRAASPIVGLLRQIQMTNDAITLPVVTADPAVAWLGEGTEITATDPTYAAITRTACKVAALVVAATEVLSDSSPGLQAVVGAQLERAVATELERTLFAGTGANGQPSGIVTESGIETITTLGADGGVPANLDLFADAIATLAGNGAPADRLVTVMHPRTWKTLLKCKELESTGSKAILAPDVAGQPLRSIYGTQILLSSQLSITETRGNNSDSSSVYVFDPQAVAFLVRQSGIVMADPYGRFAFDQVRLRLICRMNFAVLMPGAVARIVGVRA